MKAAFELHRKQLKDSDPRRNVLSPSEQRRIIDELHALENDLNIVDHHVEEQLGELKRTFVISKDAARIADRLFNEIEDLERVLNTVIVNVERFLKARENEFGKLLKLSKESAIAQENAESLLRLYKGIDNVFDLLHNELGVRIKDLKKLKPKLEKLTDYEMKLISMVKGLEQNEDKKLKALREAVEYAHALKKIAGP